MPPAARAAMIGGTRFNLVGAIISDLAASPDNAAGGYKLTSTGLEQVATGSPLGYVTQNNYIIPVSQAPNYEVRATLVSGGLATGTTGSWLRLNADREWTVTRNIIGQNTANLTIEIRRFGGSGAILATATVNFDIEKI